jgi:TolB-like protein
VQFLFGDYALDIDRRELRRGSELIPVGPQVFDLLAYLVQNRERVVSKDDLLESVWSGRIVSESTLTSHINAARKAVGDSGEEQKLIRTVARKGFRFVGELTEGTSPGAGSAKVGPLPAPDESRSLPALSLPDKPSIAVLPFENLSGDPGQEYFADGMVEDIITALSRMRWLFVIARNSSFTYKGRAVDVKQVGRELGVRYVVEGGVRKAADRVRITSQLIDATTGANIWADRFDGGIEDIFDLQDRMAESIVGAIAPSLERAEIERAKRKPTENLDAYDFFLRGMARAHQETNEAISEALRLFYKAIELDPDFASAYGMAAYCFVLRRIYSWMTDPSQEVAEATRLARRAADLGWDDAVALARGGHALGTIVGDFDRATAMIDQARGLNPNLAIAWYASGWLRNVLGEPETAIEHLTHAMRLNPLDPEMSRMQAGMAFALFLSGRYDEALSWAQTASRNRPSYPTPLRVAAASAALAEQPEVARRAVERLRDLNPTFRISNFRDLLPLRKPEDLARFEEGLRRAGLPE